MKLSDYDYNLPEELIAQHPAEQRDQCRLMVVQRETRSFSHQHFYEISQFLQPGDLLVFNDTKVIPARIFGQKSTGAKIEVLLLTRKDEKKWEALVKPGKKARPGTELDFGCGLTGVIEDTTEFGGRIISFTYEGVFEEILSKIGEMPLPPYIHEKLADQSQYQTVYAKHEGSAAAPTAGLHFTPELLNKLKAQGIGEAFVTLHVGLGTFRPVQVEDPTKHVMHSEFYSLTQETVDLIRQTKESGHRVIAVGTTAVRTLEAVAKRYEGNIQACSGWTDIFIYPGYSFQVVDSLITNFHLPKSTLLMLVSALADRELILAAYDEAVKEQYRFFSFGDAMFID